MASSSQSGKRTSRSRSSTSSNCRRCWCGHSAMRFTSRTEQNPERDFWTCRNWNKPYACTYFKWDDEDDDDEVGGEVSSLRTVMDLLEESRRKNVKLRKKLSEQRRIVFILICLLLLSWAVTLMLCVKCLGK